MESHCTRQRRNTIPVEIFSTQNEADELWSSFPIRYKPSKGGYNEMVNLSYKVGNSQVSLQAGSFFKEMRWYL